MFSWNFSDLHWAFRCVEREAKWLPAAVPGCVHTDLLRAGRIRDPFFGTNELDLQWIEEKDWEYRTTFVVSAGMLEEDEIELCSDGLDTVADVFLNGQRLAQTENMFLSHRWPVKSRLKIGENELRIHFRSAMGYIRATRTDFTPPREFNDPIGCCVRIRKQQCQFGWDWGPRFVTAGIWRPLRLEGWSQNRLEGCHISQEHHRDGAVTITVQPRPATPSRTLRCQVSISLRGKTLASAESHGGRPVRLRIPNAKKWWPAGQGAQVLHDVSVTALTAEGKSLDRINRRIGLRTVTLDQSRDANGRRFQFVVNGRPIFLKGANWIPAHSFVAGLSREDYARDLRAAQAAHMNAVRVWGGGIYESEDFYDLCDELGLLVWQDFMFACSLYPSDDAFLASVADEATQQVQRLHHRACLALWCGNNELVQINGADLRADASLRAGYEKLFHKLLPGIVKRHDGRTSYWPSSEWRGTYENGHALGEKCGDTHFWDVWHSRNPVKDYEKWRLRFCSEFGMQSYSSTETNATFCPSDDANVFGPVMENHQKNRAGNQIILDYVSRRYRFPKSQADLITLSQLNQAYCMKVGIEHYRRLMPHCMGALYWQLNDCWPVASWSSIEFTGRLKALHHEARRFLAPSIVSAHVPGDEEPIIGNYRRTSVREVHLYTVHDAPQKMHALLKWEIFHFDGRCLAFGKDPVVLRPGESRCWRTLDVSDIMKTFGRDHVYLRVSLDSRRTLLNEDTVFLAPPRFLSLPRGKTRLAWESHGDGRFGLRFTSPVFLHRFHFDLPGIPFESSDNFFDLYPERTKEVEITVAPDVSLTKLRRQLVVRSLVDTYE